MNNLKIIAVIPARYASTRFPAKLLQTIGNDTVITTTYKAALETQLFSDVWVVTDSDLIYNEIKNQGGNVKMSLKNHESGSDRIAEAVESLDVDIVVNVQGDEPFIDTVSLSKLISVFKSDTQKEIDLASLKVKMMNEEDIQNPNNVKVITDANDFAIYFSRSVIPYHRDKEIAINYYKHKGVYAFRKEALIDFYHTAMTPIEAAEKIECIRYLEVGKKIKMIETSVESIGIDTPEDLEKAIKQLENE